MAKYLPKDSGFQLRNFCGWAVGILEMADMSAL